MSISFHIPFTGNVDYNETQLTLTFPSGSRGGDTISFSVPIIDDNIAEQRESFRITASTNSNGIGIYSRTSHTRIVYINDDDRECEFCACTHRIISVSIINPCVREAGVGLLVCVCVA